jgi:hypothetical protein
MATNPKPKRTEKKQCSGSQHPQGTGAAAMAVPGPGICGSLTLSQEWDVRSVSQVLAHLARPTGAGV